MTGTKDRGSIKVNGATSVSAHRAKCSPSAGVVKEDRASICRVVEVSLGLAGKTTHGRDKDVPAWN